MLLIIHENPSAGVHIQALINAIRVVTGWSGKTPKGEDATIRILGPTFSGSADSIARGLRQADRRRILGDYSVRFITGSATDDANKQLIESALADPCPLEDVTNVSLRRVDPCKPARISFHATVQPDSLLLPQLARQISAAGWPRPIAVLFEGNTQYGRSLLDELHDPSTFVRSDLILLPFSMNISRIRNRVDDEKRGLAGVLGMPAKFRRLEMDAAGKPADQIPQLSPSTTASYVELTLSGMLRTMSTERVRTVALMATDARDKLFLARQISRNSPNVSMFTVESDSLYLHPDYSSYLQGALVASTYPLYSGNQRWSYGFEGGTERREFANGSALGIYNAALALLNYDQDGQPLPRPEARAGFRPPGRVRCARRRLRRRMRAAGLDQRRRRRTRLAGARVPMRPSEYVFRLQVGAGESDDGTGDVSVARRSSRCSWRSAAGLTARAGPRRGGVRRPAGADSASGSRHSSTARIKHGAAPTCSSAS